MTRSEFATLVDQAWRVRPTWFEGTPDRPPGPGADWWLGARLGAALPADYVWFLCEYGGGDFGRAVVYSADEASPSYVGRRQPVPARAGFVAIGDDGPGGRYFGFAIVGGTCPDRVVAFDPRDDRVVPTPYPNFLAYLAAVALRPGPG